MIDRPLGPEVPGWTPAADPSDLHLTGAFADLRPMTPEDAAPLWEAFRGADWVWDYLYEPAPADFAAFENIIKGVAARKQSPAYVVRKAGSMAPIGYLTFYTVVRDSGNIEIGNVNFSPSLQGTAAATEAFSLMIGWAFANGYRRVEWKCNALNAPSRRAAERLGFSFEGVFRQHLVVKGRNRDTAWLAMTDTDWKAIGPAHDAWLSASNFDADGKQRVSLSTLTAPHLFRRDSTV